MSAVRVGKNTYAIDPLIWDVPGFTSVYLLVGETMALVDSGSARSATTIIGEIRSLGYDPKDVNKIILSHIHFDHGSGAGKLLEWMPSAIVYVHQNGYKHLVDPSRLTQSAKKVFGTLIDEWYGGFSRVPEERIIQVKDCDVIELGFERNLRVIETQGHAKHGICLYDSSIRGLFTGDEAGMYFPECDVVIPTTPPPDFDPDLNMRTVAGLKALNADMLLFAHHLVTPASSRILDRYSEMVKHWKHIIASHRHQSFDTVVCALREETRAILKPLEHNQKLVSWILEHHIPMCVKGYIHYFQVAEIR